MKTKFYFLDYLKILLLLYLFFPYTKAQDSLYLVGTIIGESYEKRITNVNRIGDVNADGYDDFMVSRRTGNVTRDQGITQLYLGSATLDLIPDVTFHYPVNDNFNDLGDASEVGDVNGDGYDDFAISGFFGDFGFSKGKVFLYYGGETVDTIPVAEFYEPWIGDIFGGDIEEIGDLNKDGYEDFTISSAYNWSTGRGYVYLFWGGDTISWGRSITFTSPDIGDLFGASTANIGDINNDDFEDIAIGAPNIISGNDTGKVYVFFGGHSINTHVDYILTSEIQGYEFGKSIKKIENLSGDNKVHFCIMGYELIYIYDNIFNQPLILDGYSLDTGGDLNNDGFDDFILGYEGKINVYFGSDNFDINPDIILDDSLRYSTQYIYIVGDLNKDGSDEIISFAPNYPNTENPQGKVYIYSYKKLTDVNDKEENLLNNFELNQNYPNPFNPATKIRYTVPTPPSSSPFAKGRNEVGFVILKVFDVLGNEVSTLVNEYKSAGTYEVNFSANGGSTSGGDASNLSSGVYYYQLKVGSFFETKKMVLIR